MTTTARTLLTLLPLGLLVACGGTSVPASLAPAFTVQPSDATAVVGQPAKFAAGATDAVAWQWSRGGAPIDGANDQSYSTPAVAKADNNAVFSVAATNAIGSTSSGFATLHVNYLSVTADPLDVTIDPGEDATFSVSADGSGTVTYQWRRDGVALEGATAASYTVIAATLSNPAAYDCVVTSKLNGTTTSVTSAAATLSIHTALPVITAQPVDASVAPGVPAVFTVVAERALAYQWTWNGLAVQGANQATFSTPPAIGVNDGTAIAVIVTNPAGAVTSDTVTLHVNDLRITAQPVGGFFAEGSALSLSVGIEANGEVAAQWFKDGVAISGATATSFTIPAIGTDDQGQYSCSISGTIYGGTVTVSSAAATVSVVGRPIFNVQPAGAAIISGQQLTLTASATAGGIQPRLSYQWFLNGAPLLGATSATYLVASVGQGDAGTYVCVATNSSHGVSVTASSDEAKVQVGGFPVITAQPSSVTVFEGQPASFAVSARGAGTLAYQWFRDGIAINGATSATYVLAKSALADDGAAFTCVVSNGFPPDQTSAAAILTVQSIPLDATLQASTQSITVGQGVVFTYLFNPVATATFGAQGGAAGPISTGGSTTVYPTSSTTYAMTVTAGGTPQVLSVPVTVQAYTPKNLYVVNRYSNDIYQYPANAKAALIDSQGSKAFDPGVSNPANALVGDALGTHVATGVEPIQIVATSDDRFVYVANHGDSTISAYKPNSVSGVLQPLAGSPYALPADCAQPWASALSPNDALLYVACADAIGVMAVDATTGVLTARADLDYAVPGRIQGDLLIHPSGKYLFVADAGHSVVKAFTLDATGALAPNGSDLPVTFASNYDPVNMIDIRNPTGLAFDRSSSLIFSRSTDPLHGLSGYEGNNAAIETYAVDPFTGRLTFRGASQGPPDADGYNLVTGLADGLHGLVFSGLPGVDHLFNAYRNRLFGALFTEYSVDMDPTSATYGTLPGFFPSAYRFGGINEPYFLLSESSLGQFGASAMVRDRSGTIYAALCPTWLAAGRATYNNLFAYGSDAQGNIAFMGGSGGETQRAAGNNPAHGLFLGTFSAN